MAFGRQVDDAVDAVLLQQREDRFKIADVGLYERVVRGFFDVFQVGQIAGIGQFVQVDNVVVGIFVDKQTHHVGADKTGASGDEDMTFFLHLSCCLIVSRHRRSESFHRGTGMPSSCIFSFESTL